jgi:hypothetical protein
LNSPQSTVVELHEPSPRQLPAAAVNLLFASQPPPQAIVEPG